MAIFVSRHWKKSAMCLLSKYIHIDDKFLISFYESECVYKKRKLTSVNKKKKNEDGEEEEERENDDIIEFA